ncbi:hypothetical protein [Corynebacterium glyciniphilum]|uniref:hypothetical protein n=1 Tax=Corynebacterium glyciniphilum TaxID=1404244 RepID=UPI003DA1774E
MGSDKLETAAVMRFTELIDNCVHLKAKFAENDRTRLTDGDIEIFSDEEHSNPTFEARVAVQVRGRSVRKKTQKYEVSRVELEGYRKIQGVLLLVAFKIEGKSRLEPFYSILGPAKIDALLDKFKPAQNKKTIPLQRFPSDTQEIEAIVNYARRMYREFSFVSLDHSLVDNSEGISLHSATPLDLAHPLHLNAEEDDFRIEVKTKFGISVLGNVDIEVVPSSYMFHSAGFEVSSGDIVYEEVQQRRLDDRTVEAKLSEGISLVFCADSESADINISGQSRLGDRLRDLEFLFSLKRGEEFCFGENSTQVAVGESENDEFLEAELRDLRIFSKVLQEFRVNLNLVDLTKITQKQVNQMWKLHECMFECKPATEDPDETGRIRQPFAGMALELIRLKGSGDAESRYEGLTNPESGIYIAKLPAKDGKEAYSRVTPYDLIYDEHFTSTLNFRFDVLVEAYEDIADSENTGWLANRTVLRLVGAADEVPARQREFLDAAEKLNAWLTSCEPESFVNQINGWQIAFRRRELTEDERSQIRRLRNSLSGNGVDSLMAKVGCSLLLRDAEEVDYWRNELEAEGLTTLESYPIWNLRDRS